LIGHHATLACWFWDLLMMMMDQCHRIHSCMSSLADATSKIIGMRLQCLSEGCHAQHVEMHRCRP
jgi:hypothetical protein